MNADFVSEIYSSVQGEGPYTGERQVFLRLAGCPLRCDYCDTPDSLTAQGHERLSVKDVVDKVLAETQEHQIQTVSLTGGEPLAHVSFLKNVVPLLKVKGLRLYLETAGVHPEALEEIVEHLDVISMDIKLPSATGLAHWDNHEKFLEVGRGKIFVKIVLEPHSKPEELERAFTLVKNQTPQPLLVLQPVSPMLPKITAPSADVIAAAYDQARRLVQNVMVMPQQHKIWNAR